MASLTVRTGTTIERPVEEVWRYLAEEYFEHHSTWDPAVVEMERHDDGPIRRGTRGTEVRRFGGRQAAGFEITEFDEPRRFALRNTSGPFRLERTYSIAPAGRGTRVDFVFAMAPKGAMRGLFPLLRRSVAAQVRANIDRLGPAVEQGEPSNARSTSHG